MLRWVSFNLFMNQACSWHDLLHAINQDCWSSLSSKVHQLCCSARLVTASSQNQIQTHGVLKTCSFIPRQCSPPPLKKKKLPDLLRCIWKKELHPVTFAALLRLSPTKPPPVEVKDQSSHSTIARSWSKLSPVGCFPVWERCPKQCYKNPRLLWSFLSCWFHTNLVGQKKNVATCVATVDGNQPGKMLSWRCCSWRCFERPGNEKPEQLDTNVTHELWKHPQYIWYLISLQNLEAYSMNMVQNKIYIYVYIYIIYLYIQLYIYIFVYRSWTFSEAYSWVVFKNACRCELPISHLQKIKTSLPLESDTQWAENLMSTCQMSW